MSQKLSSTDTMLGNIASKSSIDKGQQNTSKGTTIGKSSLVSQNTEGRFKGKHSRKSAGSSAFQTKAKRRPSNKELPPSACTCVRCSYNGALASCCAEVLDAIDEEHEEDERFSKMNRRVPEVVPCSSDLNSQRNPCCQCYEKAEQSKENVPYVEFFDQMRDTVDKTVKKSLDKLFEKYFTCCMEKIDHLDCQVKHNLCILSNIYADLNEKIVYFQQFKYLRMRMKHDRRIHQQQQEAFLKSTKVADLCQDSVEIVEEQDIPRGEDLFSNKDEHTSREEDPVPRENVEDGDGKTGDKEAI